MDFEKTISIFGAIFIIGVIALLLYEHENEKAVELSSTVMPVPIVIHH